MEFGNFVFYGRCVWEGSGAECLPTSMVAFVWWWSPNGVRQLCILRRLCGRVRWQSVVPTSMVDLAWWWSPHGVRQLCVLRKVFGGQDASPLVSRGFSCSTKKYWESSCRDFKIHELPNVRSACSVAASYKPPMLVTRVRLPACAYFPCACCFRGVILVSTPRITTAVDHESQQATGPKVNVTRKQAS